MEKKYTDIHQVSENITLFKEDFGVFNVPVVSDLLAHVDIWLTDALGQPHFSSRRVIVLHSDKEPMCCEVSTYHLIYLNTKENYWCQWMYQFAHEYCHHLINGPFDGELAGLKWFEETICELSSMYCLNSMAEYCQASRFQAYQRFAPSVQDYLGNLLHEEATDVDPLHLYIKRNLHLLEQPEYHREIYRHIAGSILTLYLECPSLWRMILHFGNTGEWQSLTHLFDHLREEADTTYADALLRLRIMLIGS